MSEQAIDQATEPRYLCREDILIEGARLMRRTIEMAHTSGWAAAGEALETWQRRHKPTAREMRSVLRMVDNQYV